MASKNTFSVHDDTIYINGEGWSSLGMASYREDYYSELISHTWTKTSSGYLTNRSLGGSLHRYMVKKWYGDDMLSEMTSKGFVVDHINNNHMDCRISNLEFLIKDKNTAKGQWVDKCSANMRHRIALHMFKDFETGFYQITIGFNDNVSLVDDNGVATPINCIKLLYNSDYPLVVTDAQGILEEYDSKGRISLPCLHCCEIRIEKASIIELTDDEKDAVIVQRNGKRYFVIGKGKTFIEEVPFDKGWKPQE